MMDKNRKKGVDEMIREKREKLQRLEEDSDDSDLDLYNDDDDDDFIVNDKE